MARYGTKSKLSPTQILQEAVHFFGPSGIGLDVRERTNDFARFEGGGGHVLVLVRDEGSGSEIELETREWDYDARHFLEKV